MNPKISIIVPVYKVENYINKCIDSILSQAFSDFELILIDDGSPDNCGHICDQYAKQDKRIRVIHQENKGLSSARNTGLAASKGDYIGFVDSDDYIHEDMYRILYHQAEEYKADIAICNFLKVEDQGPSIVSESEGNSPVKYFTNIEALQQLFSKNDLSYVTGAGNNITWIIVCNKLFRRKLFEHVRFEEGRICEDEFIIHKLLYSSKKIIFISSKLYFYVQRSSSIIHSHFTIQRLDKVDALRERAEFFKCINHMELYYQAITSYMNAFFWNYFKAKHELSGVRAELIYIKKSFNKTLPGLIRNPFIGWRQKIAILVFVFHPSLMEKIKK
ncbi:glycosyltransferase family 2 protein [Heyndrickxia acidicola]|uniref:Glycosyltransferase n=1 Tax=Heyndrickxia acidicola TaxID=209389 RepID=A0ABU6MKJ7_9BACI|nr:glycosyltransferase [Heyndrickxia acidicola]MED1205208.1 glycosyltransferase [Heyndrickxia acidicola]